MDLKHYATLAIAFIGAKNGSDAQIIYKNIQNENLENGIYILDLNNDGIPDFEACSQFNIVKTTYCYNNVLIHQNLLNFGFNEAAGHSANLSLLNCGDDIGSGQAWTTQKMQLQSISEGCSGFYSHRGNWEKNKEGFIALKFKIGEETHYGWLRVFIDLQNHLVIKDCAYESTPNKSIPAGAMECDDQALSLPSLVNTCAGQPVTVDVNSNSGCQQFQWFKDGKLWYGGSSLYIYLPGNYYVIGTGTGCSDTSNIATVNFNSYPITPIISQSGDTLVSSQAGFYQWYLQDSIPGATQQKYVPLLNSNIYHVRVANFPGCYSFSDDDTFASCSAGRNLYINLLLSTEKAPDTVLLCNLINTTIFAEVNDWITYQWVKDGMNITGAISPALQITDSGQYYCRLFGYGINCNSDTLTVIKNSYPAPDPPVIYMSGDTLSASYAPFYQWWYAYSLLQGANNSKLILSFVQGNGQYQVAAIDSEGCATLSPEYDVENCSLINTQLNLSDTATVCSGNQVELVSEAPYFYNFDWYKDGEIQDNASGYRNSFIAGSNGLYYCIIDDYFATCISDSVYLSFINKPTISLHSDTLASSSAKYNQWVKDGEIINGANGQYYAALSSGSYAVIVSPTDTCSMMSDYVYYSITSTSHSLVENAPLISYINSRLIQVKFVNDDFLSGKIKVVNSLGQIIKEVSIDNNVIQIPFTENQTGWFVLDIEKDEHRFFSQVVIF